MIEKSRFLLCLDSLFNSEAKVITEKTRVLQSSDLIGVFTKIQEGMGQIFQPHHDELLLTVKHTDVVKAFGIMADAEFAVLGERWHTQRRVLQPRVAHKRATRAPDADTAIVVCLELAIVLAERFEGASCELNRRVFTEHVASVLTVFACLFTVVLRAVSRVLRGLFLCAIVRSEVQV